MSENNVNKLQKSGVIAIVVSVLALVANCTMNFFGLYSDNVADLIRSIIGIIFIFGLAAVYLPEIEKL